LHSLQLERQRKGNILVGFLSLVRLGFGVELLLGKIMGTKQQKKKT